MQAPFKGGLGTTVSCGGFTVRFRSNGRTFLRFWRVQIFVKRLRLWGGTAPVPDAQNLDHTYVLFLGKCQNITRFHRSSGFGNRRCIHPHLARLNQPGRQGSRFEEPRVPQPFIQTLARTHYFLSPIKAAANGLSGSMRSFFAGPDWKDFALLSRFGPPLPFGLPLPLPWGLPLP